MEFCLDIFPCNIISPTCYKYVLDDALEEQKQKTKQQKNNFANTKFITRHTRYVCFSALLFSYTTSISTSKLSTFNGNNFVHIPNNHTIHTSTLF